MFDLLVILQAAQPFKVLLIDLGILSTYNNEK